LNDHGWQAFWFPFSGQPYMINGENHIARGDFSSKDLANDLPKAVDCIVNNFSSSNKNLNIIAHCASGLITMNYLAEYPLSVVKSVIYYGLLFDASRVRARAELEMNKLGIRSILDSDVWLYNALDLAYLLRDRTVKSTFCHPDDFINHRRAKISDINSVAKKISNSRVIVFDRGYDLDNSNIETFTPFYLELLEEQER
jgi:hypothetical protein